MPERYLRIPLGEYGSPADNRDQLAAMGLIHITQARDLPDDAWVPVPVEELSYPHIWVDPHADAPSQRLMVRVLTHRGGATLTVADRLSYMDAAYLVRAIQAYITDRTVEVGMPGKFVMLERRRMELRPYYLPEHTGEADQSPAEVGADA